MKVERLNQVNYYDVFIMKSMLDIGEFCSKKEIASKMKILFEKFPPVKIPQSRMYFYSRMKELENLGFIETVAHDTIKVWSIRKEAKPYLIQFVNSYIGFLEVL